jgi:hypothetical protein
MEAITRIDEVKPNTCSDKRKIACLSALDALVKTTVIDRHEGAENVKFSPYDAHTPTDTELLVPHPYDVIYVFYLEMYLNYMNGEYERYNNSAKLYNAAFEDYEKYYRSLHKPLGGGFRNF